MSVEGKVNMQREGGRGSGRGFSTAILVHMLGAKS